MARVPASSCAIRNRMDRPSESTAIRARRLWIRHASNAKKASATSPAAVAAVRRKSNGEAKNGRSNGDAYAAAEKISASDQSAGDARRKSSRDARMATATAIAAAMYRDSGFEVRDSFGGLAAYFGSRSPKPDARASRQSSNGPHNKSTKMAAVISAIDEVMRRHPARASTRSDGVMTAVTR